jgi:D-3-phosphoglycerate dehydrogenase
MISLLRHLPEADRSVKDGKWEKTRLEGRELFGKTLGLVGSGRIGAEVAKRAHAFGMRVIAYDPYLARPAAESLGIRLVEKDEVFREADVLSVHAALTPETKGLVGATELAEMKREAILVNCARGEIVQEAALADALRSKRIAGAAIDVFEREPPTGSPLVAAPNVVFTPHLGASTTEAQARAGTIIAEQVMKALGGQRPEFVVNPNVYD